MGNNNWLKNFPTFESPTPKNRLPNYHIFYPLKRRSQFFHFENVTYEKG